MKRSLSFLWLTTAWIKLNCNKQEVPWKYLCWRSIYALYLTNDPGSRNELTMSRPAIPFFLVWFYDLFPLGQYYQWFCPRRCSHKLMWCVMSCNRVECGRRTHLFSAPEQVCICTSIIARAFLWLLRVCVYVCVSMQHVLLPSYHSHHHNMGPSTSVSVIALSAWLPNWTPPSLLLPSPASLISTG